MLRCIADQSLHSRAERTLVRLGPELDTVRKNSFVVVRKDGASGRTGEERGIVPHLGRGVHANARVKRIELTVKRGAEVIAGSAGPVADVRVGWRAVDAQILQVARSEGTGTVKGGAARRRPDRIALLCVLGVVVAQSVAAFQTDRR